MRVSDCLSDDMDTLRTWLLPSLVDVVALNRDRGRDDVLVYEIASAYLAKVGEKNSQPEEPLRLAAVTTTGNTAESGRQAFYRLKSVLAGCVEALSAPALTYQRGAAELFHPGRGAAGRPPRRNAGRAAARLPGRAAPDGGHYAQGRRPLGGVRDRHRAGAR